MMSEFLQRFSEADGFPCKHEMYELAELASTDEVLSKVQLHCTHDFVIPANKECVYCAREEE